MSKLVRDRIPELIEKDGKTPIYHQAKAAELDELLEAKLQEEVNEFLKAKTAAEKTDEAADIFEVLVTILAKYGIHERDMTRRAEAKRYINGAFRENYVLDNVEE